MHLNYLNRQKGISIFLYSNWLCLVVSIWTLKTSKRDLSLLAEVAESHFKKNNLWSPSKFILKAISENYKSLSDRTQVHSIGQKGKIPKMLTFVKGTLRPWSSTGSSPPSSRETTMGVVLADRSKALDLSYSRCFFIQTHQQAWLVGWQCTGKTLWTDEISFLLRLLTPEGP